jgi:hypothetical protein
LQANLTKACELIAERFLDLLFDFGAARVGLFHAFFALEISSLFGELAVAFGQRFFERLELVLVGVGEFEIRLDILHFQILDVGGPDRAEPSELAATASRRLSERRACCD